MVRRCCPQGAAPVAALLLALLLILLPPAPARAAADRSSPRSPGIAQALGRYFDNRAVSDDARPDAADFDGRGRSLSAGALRAAGWTPGRRITVDGAGLTWPDRAPGRPDNVRADGQHVLVRGRGDALAFLVAGTGGTAGGTGEVRYRDGSRGAFVLTAPDWRTGPLATKALALPRLNSPGGPLAEQARLYVVTVPLARGRAVGSVVLPPDGGGDLHVFALAVRAAATGWTGSWAAATSGLTAVGPWTDRTLRLVVHTSAGGPRVRIRLGNTFAGGPVEIGAASVARRGAGAAPARAPVPLTFGGAAGVRIPAGAEAFSDPLRFDVPEDGGLLVSLHLPGTVTSAPVHSMAVQESYVSEPGDHTRDGSPAAYTTTLRTWPLLTGVAVSGGPGSVVVLGDSITDGEKSTPGADHRWPDVLARRLLGRRAVPHYGVLNAGISANRVASDRYPGDGVSTDTGGVSALHRLDRDVLAQPSARTVLVFQGVNDVRWGATAESVLAGLAEIADRAHARGLRAVVATIVPCEGEARCTPVADAARQAVNDALRSQGSGFDAVLDFDAVLRDPAHPTRLAAAYDSGDHLHPNDAGLARLAQSVDLALLVPGGPPQR